MEKNGRERRRFLAALILSLGGLALLWRYFTPRIVPKKMRASLDAADVPAEGALVLRRARVAVLREVDGLYAIDLTCTHLGCTVTVTPEGMVCPCHGSRFDRHGEVVHGPAERPLRRLSVEKRGDRLVVLG